MQRRIRAVLALVAVAAIAACSDTDPSGTRSIVPTGPSPVTTVTPDIDEQIIALFPTGLETAAGVQWRNVTEKITAGDQANGEKMYWALVDWMMKKSGRLDDPAGPLTSQNALVKLISDMYAFVFPGRERPPLALNGDATIGLVFPDAPAVIVTPTKRAGVSFEAGSVAEPTLITVDENPSGFGTLCAGPLQTSLCQYPLFYRFEQFPHVRLQKAARFGVCHVNTGAFAPPEGIHDRFRLAHDAPQLPTPGGQIIDGIEILPLVSVADFMDCEDVSYTPPGIDVGSRNALERGGLALLRGLEKAARWAFVPRNAYAIDRGGGGESLEFSNFNVVDPVRPPTIDFETFPGGEATCAFCDITDQYANVGALFDFTRFDGEPLGYVTLVQGSNDPAGNASNHQITNPRVIDGTGFWTGTMILRFTGNPTTVTFLLRVNNTSGPVAVNAFAPSIEGPPPAIDPSQVTRSNTITYPSDCTDCVVFRQETITVTNAGGISRIELPGGAYQLWVDDIFLH